MGKDGNDAPFGIGVKIVGSRVTCKFVVLDKL